MVRTLIRQEMRSIQKKKKKKKKKNERILGIKEVKGNQSNSGSSCCQQRSSSTMECGQGNNESTSNWN